MASLRELNSSAARDFRAYLPLPGPAVAMFVRNAFRHDARVTKEAHSLQRAGLEVVVFAIAEDPTDVGVATHEGLTVVRVFHRDTAIWAFMQQLLRLERFVHRNENKARRLLARSHVMRAPRPGMPPVTRVVRATRRRLRSMLWPLQRALAANAFATLTAPLAAAMSPVAYHCHDENAVPCGLRARAIQRAPLIYDAHELYPHRGNLERSRAIARAAHEVADGAFARRADAVITVNRSIADHMRARYKLGHVDVVMNAPEAAGPPAGDIPLLDAIPRPRLFYSGGLQRNRGLEETVRALQLLPEAHFVAVGPDTTRYGDSLRALAREVGVADRLHVLAPVHHTRVPSVGAQTDVALVLVRATGLSYRYALPNKIFEALHAGVPIVASDLPELRRIVEDAACGVLCDPDDPASIAKAVQDVLGDPARAAELGRNARAAAQRFTWENESAVLLGVYERLGVLPARAGSA